MYPHRLVSQALRLGLLVTVLVLALSACGGDEKKAKARPLPEDEKALRPGSDGLEIARGQLEGLGFANVQDVYKPTRTGSQNVVDAPKDMVEWFQQHPYLQTSKPEPVRVGADRLFNPATHGCRWLDGSGGG